MRCAVLVSTGHPDEILSILDYCDRHDLKITATTTSMRTAFGLVAAGQVDVIVAPSRTAVYRRLEIVSQEISPSADHGRRPHRL